MTSAVLSWCLIAAKANLPAWVRSQITIGDKVYTTVLLDTRTHKQEQFETSAWALEKSWGKKDYVTALKASLETLQSGDTNARHTITQAT